MGHAVILLDDDRIQWFILKGCVDEKDAGQKRQSKIARFRRKRAIIGLLKQEKFSFQKRASVSKILRARDASKH